MAVLANPAEVNAVYALIALVADPKAAKGRLDDLTKQAEIVERGKAQAAQAAADRQAADRALGEARRVADESKAAAEARGKALDARESSLNATKADLSEREARFKDSSTLAGRALAEREQVVSEKERTISDRDTRSRALAAQVVAERDAWQVRAKKLSEQAAAL